MKLKEIENGEEFLFSGHIFKIVLEEGKAKFKFVGKYDKSKKKEFVPPTKDEVMTYFFDKGYDSMTGLKFWEYYEAADWKDGKGQQVKNWKQKAIGVWFRDENKRVDKKTNESPQMVR